MANSVIGALRVNLGLDSAKFESGARRVKKPLQEMKAQFRAVAGVAAAMGVALAGLSVKTSKTANEIKGFAQVANAAPEELQRWAVGAKTVGIEQEKLADILKDVNDRIGDFNATGGGPMADFFENIAPKVGITADAFRDLSGPQALQLYVSSLEKAGVSQQDMTFYLEAMASDTTALIPLLRNGGAEMARLGDNASSLGGIMSNEAVVSLAGLRLALLDAGTALQGVGFRISGELAPALTAMVTAFNDAMREGGFLRTVIDGLINNIDLLVNTTAVAVTAFGVRYVGALVLAKVATFSLSGALVALRGALIATGIGAFVVGAGVAVTYFTRLVTSVGGFGEALGALRNVASEVWDRIKLGFVALEFSLSGGWMKIKAGALEAFGAIAESALNTVNNIIGAYVGAFNAVVAAWGGLPAAFSRIGAQAVNMLIDAIGSGIGGVLAPINAILGRFGGAEIAPPDLSQWKVAVSEAAGVGGQAKAAFDAAFATDFVGAAGFSDGINSQVSNLREAGEAASRFGTLFKDAATAPLSSLAVLKEQITGTKVETNAATSAASDLAAALDGVGGGAGSGSGGAAIDGITDKVSELKDEAGSLKQTFKGVLTDLATGAKSFGDVVRDVISGIADKLIDLGTSGIADAIFGGGASGGAGILGGLFGGSGGGLSSLFGGFRATGGPVQSGKVYAVNENTPNTEFFAPGTSGTILRNDQVVMGGGGGGTTDVNVTVTMDQNGNLQAMVDQKISGNNARQDKAFAGKVNDTRANTHKRRR